MSGGGAGGACHVGVLKALEENNIPIDYIAGASIGAMIGGFYAVNNDIASVEKIILSNDWKKIFGLFSPAFGQGLVSGDNVIKYLESYAGKVRIESLRTPVAIMATNISNGESVCMRSGSLVTAIRASTSIPVLFEPAKRDGKLLADAGLSAPVPVDIAREMGAQFVIAVNLDADHFKAKKKASGALSLYDIADNSIMALRLHLGHANAMSADFILEPKVGNMEWTEFADAHKGIKEGEKFMRAKMPELKKALENFGKNVF